VIFLLQLRMKNRWLLYRRLKHLGAGVKRRAVSVDESSLERAERMKAARNLDFKGSFLRHALASVLGSTGTA
jgi:hypothetical protein